MVTRSKTLLLLEADDGVRELMQTIVLDHDLSMQTAHNPEDALRLISKGNVFAFAFNVGLAKSPMDFARGLKKDYPDLPLLAILADGFQALEVELLQAGTYACLELPLQVEDLAYNLNKIIAN